MKNSRNGKYGTVNKYELVSNISGNVVATKYTRNGARKAKRELVTNFNLKNTDITVIQVSESIVR